MKIRDLNLDQYVIVYDIGKSEHSKGMTVVGRVIELEFREDDDNMATIDSMGTEYAINDNNYFDLWENYIESKTESVSDIKVKWNGNGNLELSDVYEIEVSDELIESNSNLVDYVSDEIKKRQSNDVQQRKRNDKVNHPSHYNYGEIEVIDFIEQVTQHYNANVAYHIGNAIKYLARSPHKNGKEDVEKAK